MSLEELVRTLVNVGLWTLICGGGCCVSMTLFIFAIAFVGGLARIYERHERQMAVKELREHLRREKRKE